MVMAHHLLGAALHSVHKYLAEHFASVFFTETGSLVVDSLCGFGIRVMVVSSNEFRALLSFTVMEDVAACWRRMSPEVLLKPCGAPPGP